MQPADDRAGGTWTLTRVLLIAIAVVLVVLIVPGIDIDIEREAGCIADRRSRPDAFLLARAGGFVRSQGEFEVLHVRLIRGQRLLVRGTAGGVRTTTKMDNTYHIINAEPDC